MNALNPQSFVQYVVQFIYVICEDVSLFLCSDLGTCCSHFMCSNGGRNSNEFFAIHHIYGMDM